MVERGKPWVTYVLIAANLAVFGYELASGASALKPTPQQMIELGGNFGPLTLHGEWWRIGSSMFLHYGVVHILLNMVCLYQGHVVEHLFGKLGFLAIYLVAGLHGSAASLLHSTNVVSAGASGAVFGVYGAFGAFLVFRKAAMQEEAWQKTTRQIAMFVGINLLYGLSVPGIDMSAHIGGLIGGFVVGAVLLAGASAERQRTARAIGAFAIGIAATLGVLSAVKAPPPPVDVTPVLGEYDRVEAQCMARWTEVFQQFKDGTSTDPQTADVVEREVIAPWKVMREHVLAVKIRPEPLVRLFGTMESYLASRQKAWEAFVVMLRAPAPEQAALETAYKNAEADASQDLEAIKDEITRLSAEKSR